MESEDTLRTKYSLLKPQLDERTLRLCLAAEATMLGYGGVSCVARAVGVSRTTVQTGIRELKGGQGGTTGEANPAGPPRIRRPGVGRPRRQAQDKTLLADVNRLLDPVTRGDPLSALRWPCKSTTKLAADCRRWAIGFLK